MKHIIEPYFFDDVILDNGEVLKLYTRSKVKQNEFFEIVNEYELKEIQGILQPKENTRQDKDKGAIIEQLYYLYLSSSYRVYIDDLIVLDNGDILQVIEYTPYDAAGVRKAKLRALSLSERRDLKEFNQYYNQEVSK